MTTRFSRLADHPLVLFPDFARFFAGRFISSVGDKFFTIALSWWVISEVGDNSRFHLGLLMAVSMLPVVLFGPLMGTLADRFSRKACMLLADGIRALLMGGLMTLLLEGKMSLPAMYVLVFAISSFMPLFEAAANGSLECLTDEAHLSSAAAVNSSVVELSNVLGAAVGGATLAFLGTVGAFGVNLLSFVVSFALIWLIRGDLPAVSPDASCGYCRQMKEGFSWLWKMRPILALLLLFGMLNFFAAPLMIYIPMVVKFVLGADVSWVAIFEGALALGALVVAFGISFISEGDAYRRIFSGMFLVGLAMLAFALLPGRIARLVAIFFAGCGLALVNAAALAFFQHQVPEEMRGRFFAILTTVAYAVMPLALMINGILSQYISIPVMLSANGLVVALSSFLVFLLPRATVSLAAAVSEGK